MKAHLAIVSSLFVLTLVSCVSQNMAVQGTQVDTNATKTLRVSEKENTGYTNIYDYLRGKVPGLQIKGNAIYIRGLNSINSQASPMILVDGIEIQDISTVNPQDVSKVEVLKDAATSIYGFRAAGGVIKITTKAGERSQ